MPQITDQTKAELRALVIEMQATIPHEPEVVQERPDSFRGICSCGEYASKLKGSEAKAEAAVKDHIKSKETK